jgi:UDP-N-acetylmuramoylalanine--D-glutamate ligase
LPSGVGQALKKYAVFTIFLVMLKEPIGILGFGIEGQSTLKFLQTKGISEIKIFDKKDGENYMEKMYECKTIVRSAGVYPLQKEIFNAQLKGAVLTSQTELFFDIMQREYPHIQIIGVTGTLGKGSCVSMIAHCLETLNVPHAIGGNFGVPMLDLLESKNLLVNKNAVIILELSSFQLMTLGFSPHIGVVLKTTTEPLDWHASVEQYRDAKANLVRWQKRNDYCIYNAASEGAVQIAAQSGGIKKSYDVDVRTLRATPQQENMAAATLALECLGIDASASANALKTYKGLPMRLQNIGTKTIKSKTLTFLNDSYATRPEATMAAAAAMDKPFTLILGGSEKNADFTEMSQALAQNNLIKGIALIGTTAERLQKSLKNENKKIFPNLPKAFSWCIENTPDGGTVLLSPACASFGLFANYKERGEKFNELMLTL